MYRLIVSLALLCASALPAAGAGIGMTILLDTPGQWRHASYACEERDAKLSVAYVDAAPNFLALVPVDGETLVFANTVADAGVHYVASHYLWLTEGAEARLVDTLAAPDAPPLLTCLEASEIP